MFDLRKCAAKEETAVSVSGAGGNCIKKMAVSAVPILATDETPTKHG
jgi:hypothetical protein